jgi:5-methylcytosine-specific restriction protein A
MRMAMMKPRVVAADMRRVKPQSVKQTDPFYLSPEWRDLCQLLKDTRWPLLIVKQGHCCEDPHCRAQHRLGQRIYFDHVVELKDGGAPLDPDNVMGRCGSSHTRKTLRHRALRLGATPEREGGAEL